MYKLICKTHLLLERGLDKYLLKLRKSELKICVFFIGITDIVKATEDGQLKDVIYLIETGSSPNQKDATNEKNLLLIAIEQGHYDIVKYLLKIGADVNANANTCFLGNYIYYKIKLHDL